jgi:hypothetical protein
MPDDRRDDTNEDPEAAAERRGGWFDRHLGEDWETLAPGIYRLRADRPPEPPPREPTDLPPDLSEELLEDVSRRRDADEQAGRKPRPRLGWRRRR